MFMRQNLNVYLAYKSEMSYTLKLKILHITFLTA